MKLIRNIKSILDVFDDYYQMKNKYYFINKQKAHKRFFSGINMKDTYT